MDAANDGGGNAKAAAAAAPSGGKVFVLLPGTGDLKYIDWKAFDTKLPLSGDDDGQSEDLLDKHFTAHDGNGNGYLSLAEIEKLLMKVLNYGLEVKRVLSKSVARAHRATKGVRGGAGSNDDYVEKLEFPVFIEFWRYDLRCLDLFKQVDTSEDMRISVEEFKTLLPKIASENSLSIPGDLDEEFKKADRDGHGMVLYDEFADYMIRHKFNTPSKAILLLRSTARIPVTHLTEDGENGSTEGDEAGASLAKKTSMEGTDHVFGLVPGTEDLKSTNWKLFDERLPVDVPSKLSEIFTTHDGNGNGYLSLAEVENLLMKTLRYDIPVKRALSHSVARAHRATKGLTDQGNNDFVEEKEFRAFCEFWRYDVQCLELFKDMDVTEDMRIGLQEFLVVASALADRLGLPELSDPELEGIFEDMDRDGHGMVLYDEFADFMLFQKALNPSAAIQELRESAQIPEIPDESYQSKLRRLKKRERKTREEGGKGGILLEQLAQSRGGVDGGARGSNDDNDEDGNSGDFEIKCFVDRAGGAATGLSTPERLAALLVKSGMDEEQSTKHSVDFFRQGGPRTVGEFAAEYQRILSTRVLVSLARDRVVRVDEQELQRAFEEFGSAADSAALAREAFSWNKHPQVISVLDLMKWHRYRFTLMRKPGVTAIEIEKEENVAEGGEHADEKVVKDDYVDVPFENLVDYLYGPDDDT
mmetsp:Transcript_22130/g.44394  ORF Transcript_22130/g.44394 Transcript_22130/m.44394 type:complete len:700 (-) Transcript_22130:19-2118(-)